MPYSRAFTRNLGFGLLMFNADKAAGGGESQKTPSVAELAQKVKDLETEKQKVTKERDEANTAKIDAEAAQKKAETERDEANSAKDVAVKAQQKAEGERDQANTDKDAANEAKTKAEEDLKTTDERAEQRLREIDAKNGGTLPGKKAGAGDFSQEQDKGGDKSKAPRERLAAAFKIA